MGISLEKKKKGEGEKGRKSLKGRHNGKTPRGTRVSTSLESERRLITERLISIGKYTPRSRCSDPREAIHHNQKNDRPGALRSVGEENSVFDYD